MSNDRKPWRKIKSKELFANRYFNLRVDECDMGNDKVMPHYFVMDFPDWVQVIAFNEAEEIIIVDQYRYPGDGWFLEFPGGSTHPDRNESPELAARRELSEETGYSSERWEYLGFHYPNPALMGNRCHVFLARDCKITTAAHLDPYEVLEVKTLKIAEFERELMSSSKIHSLMLATYQMLKNHLRKK